MSNFWLKTQGDQLFNSSYITSIFKDNKGKRKRRYRIMLDVYPYDKYIVMNTYYDEQIRDKAYEVLIKAIKEKSTGNYNKEEDTTNEND